MKKFDTQDIKNFDISKYDASFRDRIYEILNHKSPFTRSNQPGHITASGLVIYHNKVLLIFHPYIKQWFQPGGHIDEGESPCEAAIREVYEETGLVCALDSDDLEPLDIDVHEIPANPHKGEGSHLHIDLLYRLKLLGKEQSSEEIAFSWFSFDQIASARIQRVLTQLNQAPKASSNSVSS
jgi:8-oxo-dGTP pyrophosphatase MutT (NUDIX family)